MQRPTVYRSLDGLLFGLSHRPYHAGTPWSHRLFTRTGSSSGSWQSSSVQLVGPRSIKPRRGTVGNVLERTRRDQSDALDEALLSGGATPFKPARPWGRCFAVAISLYEYWHSYVEIPGLLIVSQAKSVGSLRPAPDS